MESTYEKSVKGLFPICLALSTQSVCSSSQYMGRMQAAARQWVQDVYQGTKLLSQQLREVILLITSVDRVQHSKLLEVGHHEAPT